MAFAKPEYVLSKHFNQLIKYRSKCRSNVSYLFMRYKPPKKVRDRTKSYWCCVECRRIREKNKCFGALGSFHLSHSEYGDFISNDPNIGHYEQCLPYADSRIDAEELVQQSKMNIRNGIKRPLDSYECVRE